MDNTNHTTEHRKGQHLLSEERHEIEVRLKEGHTAYWIVKQLNRPYNTIKNEIECGTVTLYNGKIKRYKADEGEKYTWNIGVIAAGTTAIWKLYAFSLLLKSM